MNSQTTILEDIDNLKQKLVEHYKLKCKKDAEREKTQYQKVQEFHKCSGHPCNETVQKKYITENPDRVAFRIGLIREELSELEDAVRDNNFGEVVDALSDILYVTFGMGIEFGIDLDKSFDIVHNSNMTKFCKTEQEAFDTVEWYKKNEPRYDSPAYKKSPDGKFWVVYNKSNDKTLKSINYTPANFETML